jgi:hypothetical protein
MRHKIYLNIQSFVSDLVLNILLYGKYTVIETSIDLNFHRRFVSIDEYMAWTTKQVLIDLKKYTKLLTDDTTIQDLYLIMDQTRNNDDVIFDIEQLIRSIVPFSLYMDSKDHIYESYFELIECYLEDLLLFKSYSELDDIDVEPAKVKIPLPFKFEPKFIPDIDSTEENKPVFEPQKEANFDPEPESESEEEKQVKLPKFEPESESEEEKQVKLPNFDPEPESESEEEKQVKLPKFDPEPESESEEEKQVKLPKFEPEPESESEEEKQVKLPKFEPESDSEEENEIKPNFQIDFKPNIDNPEKLESKPKFEENELEPNESESDQIKDQDEESEQGIENLESIQSKFQRTRKSKKETQESYDKRMEETLRAFFLELNAKKIPISRPHIRKVFGALDRELVNRILMSIVREMIVENEQGTWKISDIDKRIIKEFLVLKGIKVPDRLSTDEKTRKVIQNNLQQLVI